MLNSLGLNGILDFIKNKNMGEFKKEWLVRYYFLNLTERIERKFYCGIIARLYGYYINKLWGHKVWVKKIEY